MPRMETFYGRVIRTYTAVLVSFAHWEGNRFKEDIDGSEREKRIYESKLK